MRIGAGDAAVPAGTHILALSVQGYCQMAGMATGERFSGPRQCVDKIKSLDGWVTTQYQNLTDGADMYHFIETRVNPWISQKLGF